MHVLSALHVEDLQDRVCLQHASVMTKMATVFFSAALLNISQGIA